MPKKPNYELKAQVIGNGCAKIQRKLSLTEWKYQQLFLSLETGKEELYQYDALEKTVQRYNTLILDMYKEQSDKLRNTIEYQVPYLLHRILHRQIYCVISNL